MQLSSLNPARFFAVCMQRKTSCMMIFSASNARVMNTRPSLRALMVLALLASALPARPDEKPGLNPAPLPTAPSAWGDDPYYEDYDDDFHYTRRLRRFHTQQARYWGYYDPYFTNDVYFVIGTPYWYAWNNWYNPWSYRSQVVVRNSRRGGWIYTQTYVHTNGWNPWGYPVAVYYSDWHYRGFYDPYWYDFSWSPWDWGWTSWSGYNRGYRRGYWNGYSDGYRNGWQNGWQNGYCVGYLNGSSNRSGAGYASDYWYRRNDPDLGVSQRPIIRPRTTTQGIAIPQPGLPGGRQGLSGPTKSSTPASPAPDLRENARIGNGQVAPRASLPGSTPSTPPPARDEWSRSPSTALPPRAGQSSAPGSAETPSRTPDRIVPAPPSRTPAAESAPVRPQNPYTRTAPPQYQPRTNPYNRPAPSSSESARPAPRVETPSYSRPAPQPESRPRVETPSYNRPAPRSETPSYNRPAPQPESRPRVETPSYNRPSPAPESRPRVETPSYNRPAPESRPRVETPSSRPSAPSPSKGSAVPARPSGPGKGGN
jgi:hypothetical protein